MASRPHATSAPYFSKYVLKYSAILSFRDTFFLLSVNVLSFNATVVIIKISFLRSSSNIVATASFLFQMQSATSFLLYMLYITSKKCEMLGFILTHFKSILTFLIFSDRLKLAVYARQNRQHRKEIIWKTIICTNIYSQCSPPASP